MIALRYFLYNSSQKIIGTIGNSIDITKQKSLQLQKQRAEVASQSKSTFIANMSHHLRTPLTGIMSMI